MTVTRINEGSTSTPSDELPTQAEWFEAKARRLMAERAMIPNWGDGRRERRAKLAEIDAAFDAWKANC